MSDSARRRHRVDGPLGRVGAYAVLVALVFGAWSLGGCTGDEPRADPGPASTATDRATPRGDGGSISELVLARDAAPRVTRVTRVWGRWPDRDRAPRTERLARRAGRAVHGWMTRGFVSAEYPTRRFGRAFATFTRGAAGQADRQGWLTTNRPLGDRLVDVVPVRRTVRLVAFAPRGSPVGATAEVELALLGLDRSGRRIETSIIGELFLTRGPGVRWQVFGYDLRRADGAP